MAEHGTFGVVADRGDGVLWSETVEVGDQQVDLELRAIDAAEPDGDDLDLAAAALAAVDGFDVRARGFAVSALDEPGGELAVFLQSIVEELGPELPEVLVDRSGDDAIDLIRSLVLRQVSVFPAEREEGEPFASFRYGLDVDEIDQELVVRVTRSGQAHSVLAAD